MIFEMTELGSRMLTVLVCLKTSSQSDCLLGEGGALWKKKKKKKFILRMCLRLLYSGIVSDLKFPLHKVAYVSFASLERLGCSLKWRRSVRLLIMYPPLI